MKIQGLYNSAICMIDDLEPECIEQIQNICSLEYMKDAKIRIMPDSHAGKGICIGFTGYVNDRICPNFVGVDISCSISTYKLNVKDVDFEKLDSVIRQYIPSGNSVRQSVSELVTEDMKEKVREVCFDIEETQDSYKRHLRSIGSLGGGNHFLELNRDKDGYLWLSIHCGSRNLGKKICEYHQNVAIQTYQNKIKAEREYVLSQIPPREREAYLKNNVVKEQIKPEQCYVEGEALDLYIKHMKIAEEFATMNHQVILHEICSHMGWEVVDSIFTHHNYIEFLGGRQMVIRKGAISAKKGERVIIPLNMKDGSIIGVGKGNVEWNESAPHGAGRVLSRAKAKESLSLEQFKEEMDGIWTSCISENTLDESPMAYKDMSVIMSSIGESVEILDRIVPIYNFKAN